MLYIFASFCMQLQYWKCYLYGKYKHRYPYIQGHERVMHDVAWRNKTDLELTKLANATYLKMDGGTNIFLSAYKAYHIPSRTTAGYPLEIVA